MAVTNELLLENFKRVHEKLDDMHRDIRNLQQRDIAGHERDLLLGREIASLETRLAEFQIEIDRIKSRLQLNDQSH